MDDGVTRKSINRRDRVVPCDEGWSWMILLGGVVSNIIISGGLFKSFGVLFTSIQRQYLASAASIAWIPSLVVSLGWFMGVPSNMLTKRFGTRAIVMTGGCLASAGFLLSMLATDIYWLYVTYGIMIGMGSGLAYSPGIVIVGTYFDKKRALANGIAYAGSGLGSIVIPPLLTLFVKVYDLKGSFLLMAAVTLNVCVAGALYRPHSFYDRAGQTGRHTTGQANTINGGGGGGTVVGKEGESRPIGRESREIERESRVTKPELDTLIPGDESVQVVLEFDDSATYGNRYGDFKRERTGLSILLDYRLGCYAISAAVSDACYSAVFMAVTPYCEQMTPARGLDVSTWLLSAMGCADLVSRLLVAVLADRRIVRNTTVYHVALGLSAVSALLISRSQSPQPILPSKQCDDQLTLLTACCLYATVGGAFIALIPTILADEFGIGRLPDTWALTACYVGVSQLTVPTMAGAVKDWTGTWTASFYMCSALVAAVLAVNLTSTVLFSRSRRLGRRRMECQKTGDK